ncbi:MAG TPA: GNAT family N-acetyltransferase [Stellaceae bacterium]
MTDSAAARLAWRVEEAELNAYPPVRQVWLSGWLVRFSEGGPRRGSNSASPLLPDCDASDRLINTVTALYRRRGSAPLFRVPSIIPAEIDERLAACGWSREGDSCVLYGEMRAMAAETDRCVRLSPAPSTAWFAAMAQLQGRTREQSAVYRRNITAIALPSAFAALAIDGRPAALAYAVVHDGLLCYQSVITARDYRRRGLARRIVAALAAWGGENGAMAACLQVEAGNAPARALYAGCGMTLEISRYHYRRSPPGVAK